MPSWTAEAGGGIRDGMLGKGVSSQAGSSLASGASLAVLSTPAAQFLAHFTQFWFILAKVQLAGPTFPQKKKQKLTLILYTSDAGGRA